MGTKQLINISPLFWELGRVSANWAQQIASLPEEERVRKSKPGRAGSMRNYRSYLLGWDTPRMSLE